MIGYKKKDAKTIFKVASKLNKERISDVWNRITGGGA